MTHTFLIGFAFSKDTLMAGHADADFACVTVLDEGDPLDARLRAEQMVAAVGLEPTSVEEVTP